MFDHDVYTITSALSGAVIELFPAVLFISLNLPNNHEFQCLKDAIKMGTLLQ